MLFLMVNIYIMLDLALRKIGMVQFTPSQVRTTLSPPALPARFPIPLTVNVIWKILTYNLFFF